MFDEPVIRFFIGTLIGAALVIGGVKLAAYLIHRHADRQGWATHEEHKAKDQATKITRLFCRSCGSRFATVRHQSGFDGVTGSPVYTFMLRCPKWTPATTAWLTSAMAYGMPMARWPEQDCDKKVSGSTPGAHNHEIGADSAKCPACIDVLFNSGALDEKEAIRLYNEAGVA